MSLEDAVTFCAAGGLRLGPVGPLRGPIIVGIGPRPYLRFAGRRYAKLPAERTR